MIRARWIFCVALAGCAGSASGSARTATDPAEPDEVATPVESTDPRVNHLRTMTDLLRILTDEVEVIVGDAEPSPQRCDKLADAVVAWGGAHYEAYELADAEGSFLGLTAADVEDPAIRLLARELALVSTQLIELVDEDCLYGSGRYGDALYEYLIGFLGLAHWSNDGNAALWDYETLIAEAATS